MYVQGMNRIMGVDVPVLFTPVFHVRHATHSVCHLKRWKWFRAVPYVGVFVLCIMNLWVKY